MPQKPPAPVHNPNFLYDLVVVHPDGHEERETRYGEVTGWLPMDGPGGIDEFLIPTLLHGKPIRSRVENIRAADRKTRKELPKQPELFARRRKLEADAKAKRGAGPARLEARLQAVVDAQGDNATHPGVKPWEPDAPSAEALAADAEDEMTIPDPERPQRSADEALKRKK
jgi:hypothetical protein